LFLFSETVLISIFDLNCPVRIWYVFVQINWCGRMASKNRFLYKLLQLAGLGQTVLFTYHDSPQYYAFPGRKITLFISFPFISLVILWSIYSTWNSYLPHFS
jgi:hypothetical protein